MKKLILTSVLLSSMLLAGTSSSETKASKALSDLDCEFEDCTPKEPQIKIVEKPVIVEKIVIKEVPVDRNININIQQINSKEIENKNTIKCNQAAKAGTTKPEAYQVNLGKNSGEFQFEYETYTAKDRITIVHENKIIFDSGCVGTNGFTTQNIKFDGTQQFVTIQTIPNCENEPSSSTQWTYTAHCPK